MDLPREFVERLKNIVPKNRFDLVLHSFTRRRAVGFRVNTLVSDVDAVMSALGAEDLDPQPVPWKREAFWLPSMVRERLLASKVHERQEIYVQNLSSMLPPVVLAAQPGERVLDLAAAPGSKTLQIACDMQGDGELAAVEAVRSRFFKLKENLRQQGAHGVQTYLQNGERVWRYRPEYFDRVLLDAPCSTEGRFSLAEPQTLAYWTPRKIKEMARKQRRLLYSAVQSLRPGGRLVYSTCAFAPEENEGAVAYAIETFGDALEVEPIDLPLENTQPPLMEWRGRTFPESVRSALRVLPDEWMEGFFVCAIRKLRASAGFARVRSGSTRRSRRW